MRGTQDERTHHTEPLAGMCMYANVWIDVRELIQWALLPPNHEITQIWQWVCRWKGAQPHATKAHGTNFITVTEIKGLKPQIERGELWNNCQWIFAIRINHIHKADFNNNAEFAGMVASLAWFSNLSWVQVDDCIKPIAMIANIGDIVSSGNTL